MARGRLTHIEVARQLAGGIAGRIGAAVRTGQFAGHIGAAAGHTGAAAGHTGAAAGHTGAAAGHTAASPRVAWPRVAWR